MPNENLSADESHARRQKMENFKKAGVEPYPAQASPSYGAKTALADFKSLEKTSKKIKIAGRIKTLRVHGGLAFLTIEDETDKIQIALQRKNIKDYSLYHG